VGLTGGIACGKSGIRQELERLGAAVCDADQLSREAVVPGSFGLGCLVNEFGEGILQPDGTLDRRRLGAIAFADPEKLRVVERCLHPIIESLLWGRLKAAEAEGRDVFIYENSIIVEKDDVKRYDALVVAYVNPTEQLRRLIARNGLTEEEARQRFAVQAPQERKLAVADYIIDTSGSREESDRQVYVTWTALRKAARQRSSASGTSTQP
jgi:dephospho-CoA kinase